jgi:glycosyltransferase involved in cell wall biosynthesis
MKIAIIPRPSRIKKESHAYCKRHYHLVEGLLKLGHEVKIFARDDSELPKGTKVIKWSLPRKTDYPSQIEYMSRAIKESQDCDIINCQSDHLALTFDKWSKVPIVHTIIYGRLPQYIEEYLETNKKSNFSTISKFLQKRYDFIKFKGMIYNGLNLEDFPLSENKKDFFLYLSRISPDKQTHLLISWAKKYDFKLILAGDINDQEYFKKEIKPNLSRKIRYIGKLDFEKVKYLQEAKATFMLDDQEGFGNSTIESLACGTPVIGFNNGAFTEIITNKKDGYILKSTRDVKNALKTVETINPLDCRKKVEDKFTVEKMVKEYEKLYKKIIQQNNRRG